MYVLNNFFSPRYSRSLPTIGCLERIFSRISSLVAMVAIFKRFEAEGLKSKMILQVHDELNFNVLKEEQEKVKQIVLEEMEGAIKLEVPLIADCGEGANWLEAH